MSESCCTCATLLKDILSHYDEKHESEKASGNERRLDCCGRVICWNCIAKNRRFATYCPFCQVSIVPTPLPQGLRDPPSYAAPPTYPSPPEYIDTLPSYSSLAPRTPPPEKSELEQPAEDALHFLDHNTDSLAGLSLRYGVPIDILRRANLINSDHLLQARRTVVIPGEFYKGGVSLSPRPVEGEEEEKRKAIVRRFMVGCKVSEYDVALLYLKQVDYDLEAAIETYREDERWEKEHPVGDNVKGKGKKQHDVGRRRFTGLRS